jgi:drug/metabolite transporter (DMT)-like permease
MTTQPARWRVLLAFAAIYLIWGTTYLAIRYAIETLPPFLMGATRFFLAGGLLYGYAAARGLPRARPSAWYPAAVSAALLFLVAQGGVAWAEQYIASGLAALLVATMPIWMLVLDWARPAGQRPSPTMAAGVVLGFSGVVLLLAPWQTSGRDIDIVAAAVVLVGAVSWVVGSLYTRAVTISSSHLRSTAMQMLCGAVLLLAVGTVSGEWGRLSLEGISLISVLAVLYLAIMGSLVALTAYTWLLSVAQPSRVATYAYVNPIVALFLGWLLAGEVLNTRMVLAAAVIVASVAVVTVAGTSGRASGRASREAVEVVPAQTTGSPERA